jgi:Ni2+-binding GTPase involved in maturation of urease and hydrogenase
MHLYLVGGFLGSGKTTAIQQACIALKPLRVAVITNDQGNVLVDSRVVNQAGIPLKEVTEGCFCCHYDQLKESIQFLVASVHPDIIFAESVGSCTDLVATVIKPLTLSSPDLRVVLSVFVDAYLLWAIYSGQASFLNEDVRYIFKKQIEEADLLVLNKIDLLDEGQRAAVEALVVNSFPDKHTIWQNSLEPEGTEEWLHRLQTCKIPYRKTSIELDYDRYAAGEASMGWLDAELEIFHDQGYAMDVAQRLIYLIHGKLKEAAYSIGHLKFFVDDGETAFKLSFTAMQGPSPVRNKNTAKQVHMLINARVAASPSLLKTIVTTAIQELMIHTGAQIIIKQLSAFQPGYPKPQHRMS